MASIFVATPCYGDQMLRGYVNSLLRSMVVLHEHGHSLHLVAFGNESLITRARNNLAAQFLGTKHDALMFIDADITWQPQALLELIESKFPVCGIPYPTKRYNWDKIVELVNNPKPNAAPMTSEKLNNLARLYTVNSSSEPPSVPLSKGWHKVNALGTGFLLIRRDALEKMRDHYRESLAYVNDVGHYLKVCPPEQCVAVFDTMIEPETRRYLSEDYAFCRRWRDIGGEIFSCGKHRLMHTGTATF
ncbi:MAG TPA: hypothetical protein VHA82_05775 [Ramlibacter sp.]|uniref:hypothetical protein n=1 Tax=Ramlibacter sp. TaxID=1917967 RepID=UPI002BB575FE|nr:hypothetical protein [Ramlibacter sp.]HVZ43300.1 hypothetical protein [Ramlibacter sp.]